VDNPFDIGEITLTTKGKDSDPSTTAITTVSRDAAVLMLGMAKEDISWIVGKLRARYSWSKFLLAKSTFSTTNLKDEKSVGAAWAIKPVVGTREGAVTTTGKSRE
jgi:hypothetical protein